MSDTSAVDAAAADAAAEASAAAPVADTSASGEGVEGSAPSSEATSMLDSDLPDGMKQFPREYVERLRAEAAENRVAAREARQQLDALNQRYGQFEGVPDQDLQVWGNMAQQWGNDQAAVADTMRTIANNVLGDPTATRAEKAEAAADIQKLDAAEATGDTRSVEQMIDERLAAERERAAQNEAVQAIERQVTDAGYAKGTQEYAQVLWLAANETQGDIPAALEKFEGFKQSIIDGYVQQARAGGIPPATPDTAVTATGHDGPPKNVKEAGQRARAFLRDRG